MKNKGLVICICCIVFLVTGEVKCIMKAVQCNWEPVGKAEIVYTASALTGIGSVVGWVNIEDN